MTPQIALQNLANVVENFAATPAQHRALAESLQALADLVNAKPASAATT